MCISPPTCETNVARQIETNVVGARSFLLYIPLLQIQRGAGSVPALAPFVRISACDMPLWQRAYAYALHLQEG